MFSKWTAGPRAYAPAWMIIGISLVLMAVVVFMGLANYKREEAHMVTILKERGSILIKSFEAGTQTGMMGLFGNDVNMQTFLEKTAAGSEVAYIALVSQDGTILAHNDRSLIGTSSQAFTADAAFDSATDFRWRTVVEGNQVEIFEVYKSFLPVAQGEGHHGTSGGHMGMHKDSGMRETMASCSPGWVNDMPRERLLDPENRPLLVVGMDMKPFEEVKIRDIRNFVISAGLIFLLAVTGVISLFWAQHHVHSRKLLQDIRAMASEIVRNLPVGIVVVGSDDRIGYSNEVACSLLGMQTATTRDMTALPEALLEMRSEIGQQKKVVTRELRLPGGVGIEVPVSIIAADIIGEDGGYVGCMFILQDLSELRRLEKKVRQREKLAAVGDLAAGIAHEVRNPLSSIKGYVTYFGSLFDKDSENRRAAEITAEEVDRVNRVISELLEFARPSDLKLAETDIRNVIRHTVGLVAYEADSAGVAIDQQISPALPPLMLDADRITQVLLNLLINAVQAMNQGGRLSIAAEPAAEAVEVSVQDTGGGIATKDQANIFNPYFTTKKNGTGLGLAIAHKIIEGHGGTIRIESREGSGTRVLVTLPLQPRMEELI